LTLAGRGEVVEVALFGAVVDVELADAATAEDNPADRAVDVKLADAGSGESDAPI